MEIPTGCKADRIDPRDFIQLNLSKRGSASPVTEKDLIYVHKYDKIVFISEEKLREEFGLLFHIPRPKKNQILMIELEDGSTKKYINIEVIIDNMKDDTEDEAQDDFIEFLSILKSSCIRSLITVENIIMEGSEN